MWVEGGFFFKISKRDSTFIREMRVPRPGASIKGGQGRGNCPPRFCQNRRRRRAAAVHRITTCPSSFRKLLTPLLKLPMRIVLIIRNLKYLPVGYQTLLTKLGWFRL